VIDEEVRKLITRAHDEARTILTTHRDALDRIADALIQRETLDAKEVTEIFDDVPKWEHTAEGSMRIQAPNGQIRDETIAAVMPATTEDGKPS
jgi:uncharacterized membrane protein